MATKSRVTRRRNANRGKAAGSRRMDRISSAGVQIVRDAAALLDEELAAGIVAAKRVQQRFRKERRIDSADFAGALNRFQTDAHQAVNLLSAQVGELGSRQNTELMNRFLSKSHDLVDLVLGMVNLGAELTNQLAQSNLPKQNPGKSAGQNAVKSKNRAR